MNANVVGSVNRQLFEQMFIISTGDTAWSPGKEHIKKPGKC